jgi:TRAP-type C4-dicarboxylate transport system permease small subunit
VHVKAKDVPPHIAERYRLGTPRWTIALAVVVIAAFGAAIAYGTWQLAAPKIQSKVLTWQVLSPEHTDVTFEIRRNGESNVWCVLRAQDESHIDVAYVTIPFAAGASYVQLTYPLRTLATAYTVEILACEAGGPPVRVIPPQFPPGVFPPEQPWTPNSA